MTPDPAQVDVSSLRALLEGVLGLHQRSIRQPGGPCICGKWPKLGTTWPQHLAEEVARNAIPALLDEVETLRAKVAAVEALMVRNSTVAGHAEWVVVSVPVGELHAALESTP